MTLTSISHSSCYFILCAWAHVALALSPAQYKGNGAALLTHIGQDVGSSSALTNLTKGKPMGECGKKVANPPHSATMACPGECPFIRPDTAHFCAFSCVAKEDCDNRNPLTSFADEVTHTCAPCGVPGCLSCGKHRYECKVCSQFLELTEDGKCVTPYENAWNIVYCCVGLIAAVVLYYLVGLAWRPVVNTAVVERAEKFRRSLKLFQWSENSSTPYPLDTNLCRENVAGVGVQLHFSFQRYMILWATVVMIAMFILSQIPLYSLAKPIDHNTHPSDGDVMKACAELGSDKFAGEIKYADKLYLNFTIAIYMFSTIGSLIIFVHHRHIVRHSHNVDKLRNYALEACGFPPCVGGKDEEDHYKDFFQKAYPFATIIGVSIAWDSRASNFDSNRQADRELNTLDRTRDDLKKAENRRSIDSAPSEPLETLESLESDEYDGIKRTCHHYGPNSAIDHLLLGCTCCLSQEEKHLDESDLALELLKMTSTGTVYVVFQTRAQCDKAFKQGSTLKYGESDIQLKKKFNDPETQLWGNMTVDNGAGTSHEKFWKSLASVVGLFAVVTLWAVLVYHPVASYLLSWNQAPGMQRPHSFDGSVQGILLSVPIILSNQILYQVCAFLSEWIKFTTLGSQELAYTAMYTVFVSYQTVLDVMIVIQTAYGQHDVNSWKVAQASGVLGPKAIAQNPSIRETLYLNMVGYLYPGTLLLPYLVEPLTLGIGQYFVFKWLIRSRKEIGIQKAEDLLASWPFDLLRYGDILVSMLCCCLVCFIASPDVYKVFIYFLIMLVFCYIWDHYRLLRLCPRFFLDDNKLADFSVMSLSFPCALLAAAVVFRTYGSQDDPYLTRETVPVWCFFAFFIHLGFHLSTFMILMEVIKTDEVEHADEEDCSASTYEEVAQVTPHNWFNTNYVHCLRSKYVKKDEPTWCIPVKHGREYLIRKAPELGLFYEHDGHGAHALFASDLDVFAKKFDGVAKHVGDAKRAVGNKLRRNDRSESATSATSMSAEGSPQNEIGAEGSLTESKE